MKRLEKDSDDALLYGVCSGVTNYLNIDPTIIRLIWIGATIISPYGLLLYIILALIMPED